MKRLSGTTRLTGQPHIFWPCAVYLFISLAHFDHQVIALFIHLVNECMQLSAGVLKTETDMMFIDNCCV